VSIDLEERLSDEIVGAHRRGRRRHRHRGRHRGLRGLTTYPFRSDRFVLVVAREHALARRAKIGFAEVLDHDFVGLDRASALQRFLAGKARARRTAAAAARAAAQLRRGLPPVERNVGVGIVPATTARRAAKGMAIKAIDLTDPWRCATSPSRARLRGPAAVRAAAGGAYAG